MAGDEDNDEMEESTTPTKSNQAPQTQALIGRSSKKHQPSSPSSSRSSSSDTYHNNHITKDVQQTQRHKVSPSRTNVVTPIMVKHVAKLESASDEEEEADTK